MALASFTAYKTAVSNPSQTIHLSKNSLTTIAGRMSSLYATAPFGGAAPTTAVVPTNSLTNGFVGQVNAGSAALRLGVCNFSFAQTGIWILCDRLSHQGGLVGNVNTTQTTNLSTAALTRYTNGVGVWMALEIYSQIGTTGANVTCSYTNQGGSSGQTSISVPIGATGFREVGRMIFMPPQGGDYGVQAVASVALDASTGTAGNIGVTLFKPLISFPAYRVGQMFTYDPFTVNSSQMPEILDDACLFWVFLPSTSSSGIMQATLTFFED